MLLLIPGPPWGPYLLGAPPPDPWPLLVKVDKTLLGPGGPRVTYITLPK